MHSSTPGPNQFKQTFWGWGLSSFIQTPRVHSRAAKGEKPLAYNLVMETRAHLQMHPQLFILVIPSGLMIFTYPQSHSFTQLTFQCLMCTLLGAMKDIKRTQMQILALRSFYVLGGENNFIH